VHRTAQGDYAEADGIRWTDAENATATRTDAPLALADLLRIPPGEPMLTYDALQTADEGRLRQLHRTYIPFSVLADSSHDVKSLPAAPELYRVLAELGHELSFTERVRPRMPLPDQAQALRLGEGVPVLHILRLVANQEGRPLALEEFHLPGEDLEVSYPL
jgi:GntR family transcriptional regulator